MPEISGMIQQFLEGNIKTLSAEPIIESKTITENGTYTAPEGVDGYSPVVVNVPSDEPVIESKTITENGTYTPESGVDGFAPVVVNVPLPSNAYLLKSVNTPTPIASFNDGEEMPMPSLKVAIEPQQEGSGDPSPTNVRPISGWTECNVTRTGKNLFDVSKCIKGGNYYTPNGTQTTDTNIKVAPALWWKSGTYNISWNANEGYTRVNILNIDKSFKERAITTNEGRATLNLTNSGFVQFAIDYSITNIQCELGSTATTYEPYNGQTYTIDLDGTRYGGTLDVVNGIVTPAPYYASYNGETLIGEWISDRDKYEVGATPTIGAQVVNIGASGTPVSIQPTAIKSLRGVNNVYANTGDIKDAEYFSKED